MKITQMVNLLHSFRNVQPVKFSELLVLGLLSHRHLSGYDIYKYVESRIVRRSNAFFKLEKATLYNTLSRLEKMGLIEVAEKKSDEKRPPRYLYTITTQG